jgi:hypothetical protein
VEPPNPEKAKAMIGELIGKLGASKAVYDALRTIGLDRDGIFNAFDVKKLDDGSVRYSWKKSG